MPGDPRPWEQRNVRDRELSPSVSIAITFSFLLAAMMTMVGSAVDSSEIASPWMMLVPWPVREAAAIDCTGR
jgi:hypothetical protein